MCGIKSPVEPFKQFTTGRENYPPSVSIFGSWALAFADRPEFENNQGGSTKNRNDSGQTTVPFELYYNGPWNWRDSGVFLTREEISDMDPDFEQWETTNFYDNLVHKVPLFMKPFGHQVTDITFANGEKEIVIKRGRILVWLLRLCANEIMPDYSQNNRTTGGLLSNYVYANFFLNFGWLGRLEKNGKLKPIILNPQGVEFGVNNSTATCLPLTCTEASSPFTQGIIDNAAL